MDTPLSRAHNMIRSVINSGGTVSKFWMEDAFELLAKDGGLTPLAPDAGDSAVSTSSLQASAEYTSQTVTQPTQRG